MNFGRSQISVALRFIRVSMTVSNELAFFLAGMPPTDLLSSEREMIEHRVILEILFPLEGRLKPSNVRSLSANGTRNGPGDGDMRCSTHTVFSRRHQVGGYNVT